MLVILGMRDNAGREEVREALLRVEGVVDASVSLMRATAVIDHSSECRLADLVAAVASARCVATRERDRDD